MNVITFNPAQYHLLSLVASAQGLTVEEYVSATLNRLFRSLAELQGISPALRVEPGQVQAPAPAGGSAQTLTRAERRAANRSGSAAAPTPEQAAELERQRALYSRPAPGRELEACKVRIPEDAE